MLRILFNSLGARGLGLTPALAALAALVAIISLVAALYASYLQVKAKAYNEGYTKASQEYIEKANTKIDAIESALTTLAVDTSTRNTKLTNELTSVIKTAKGKPILVVKDGGCVPNATFSDALSEVNSRINESLKESQK